MGEAQKLRHTIRLELAAYAARHGNNFNAHMTSAAVQWLLGGRPGLTNADQAGLVTEAARVLGELQESRPNSPSLAHITGHMRDLQALVAARHEVATAAPDFELWAAELAVKSDEEAGENVEHPFDYGAPGHDGAKDI
jgi:hypothetical protein